MKSICKSIILACLFAIYFSLYFINQDTTILLSDVVIKCSFGYHDISYYEIIQITMEFFPILVFIISFGTEIYKRFCVAKTYYFSRCKSILKWYINEVLKLFIKTLLFTVLLPLLCFVFSGIGNTLVVDKESVLLLLYYMLIYTSFLFSVIILINMLAVRFGTIKAYGSLLLIIAISTISLSLWINKLPLVLSETVDFKQIARNGSYLKYNLVANLIFKWHTSSIKTVDDRIGFYPINFDLNVSGIIMLSIMIISIGAGYLLIRNIDIVQIHSEVEG